MDVVTKRTLSATMIAIAVLLPGLYRGLAQERNTVTPTARPTAPAMPQTTVGSQGPPPEHAKFESRQIEAGGGLFIQNCAFCHGKDAGGGESGPDLTRSKLVTGDQNGEAIGSVIHNGRLEKGMPRFALSDIEVLDLVAFIHSQQDKAMSQTGTRKGVDESDLNTGNAEAGKRYFEGAGGCTKCHSSSKDLAGVATRYTGLRLLEEMLYPRDVKATATVKTRNGQTFAGPLEYQDEFRIGLKDSTGLYHSWSVSEITFQVQNPVEQHVEIMSKYTDSEMHNVFSYLQTLK